MTMETYIVRAGRDKINRLSAKKIYRSDSVSLFNFDPTVLAKLESIITGEDTFYINERGYEKKTSDKNLVYEEVSPKLIKALRKLTFNKKNEVLKQWLRSQELALYNPSPVKIAKILDWLISCSRDIDQMKTPLYICFCETCTD